MRCGTSNSHFLFILPIFLFTDLFFLCHLSFRYGREQHVAAEVHARIGAAVVRRGRSVREQVLERNGWV